MRKYLMAAAGMAAFAAPAAAQQQPVPQAAPEVYTPEADTPQSDSRAAPQRMDPRDEAIVRSLPEQREIEAMGDRAVGVVDAIMNVPVGPLREAIEGRRLSRREREETLGDVAHRDDPYYRERMRDQIAVASVAVGVLAEQMAVMAPVLRRTLEDTTRQIEDAARGLPPRPPRSRY